MISPGAFLYYMPRTEEIYSRSNNKRYPWIIQNISDKHIFWECYWCKRKDHAVSTLEDYFNNDILRQKYQNFILGHKTCRDMSIQLEMAL
jgi:hypothetical protein